MPSLHISLKKQGILKHTEKWGGEGVVLRRTVAITDARSL